MGGWSNHTPMVRPVPLLLSGCYKSQDETLPSGAPHPFAAGALPWAKKPWTASPHSLHVPKPQLRCSDQFGYRLVVRPTTSHLKRSDC